MLDLYKRSRLFRIFVWVVTGIIALLVIATVAAYAASTPLRNFLQGKANQQLEAYTVKIGKVRFNPIGFSMDLYDLEIIQNANADPPVAFIPHLKAGLHWSNLIRARVVGDFSIDRPRIHLDLKKIREEQEKGLPAKKESWQQVVQSIYPLKIDVFTVRDADLTYIDKGPHKPLTITKLNIHAGNIRNIKSPEHVYPSTIHLDGNIFETGKIVLDGNANFMAEPHLTAKAEFGLQKIDLEYLKPIAGRYNFAVTAGLLSAAGDIEYAIREQIYNLRELTIDGVRLDYIHLAKTAEKEKQRAKKAAETAEDVAEEPTVTTEIDLLKISGGNFGFVNKAADPTYRVFIADTGVTVENFSNQFAKGPSRLKLRGKFMGSGTTRIDGTFRPEKSGPDFDLKIAIEGTRMRPMSDLFRAYGNFAIEAGLFSFYSELAVKEKRIDGYVKPLFEDMEVTDKRTEDEKSLFQKLYVGIVGAISKLLENPEEKVATEAEISGALEDPDMSTWQVIERLIQNAFFKSILPGFSENIG